ncbi:MAG: hypothetical protein JXP73_21735 [Deltaproteobacteria bacterium]|nr:hypothetical protein [Deltaproteobacteria bacterium]
MLTKLEYLSVVLFFVGCGSKTNSNKPDVGVSHDASAVADSLGTSDVPAPSDSRRDSAGPPDGVADGESPREDLPSAPVEAAREAPTLRDLAADDLVHQDRPAEDGPGDVPAFDLVTPSDQTGRDRAPEGAVADAAVADVVDVAADVPPEAAREVPPFAVDGSLASFCSGDIARMVVNGIESRPAVRGIYYLLSCCAAGAISVATATFIEPIAVGWLDWGMAHTASPVTFDLANLPDGFTVRVVAGCDPQDMSCTLPCDPKDTGSTNLGDGYDSGFTGVLAIARTPEGYDTSLCLHVEEPAGSPHPILHSLDLYAPHVLVSHH